MILVFTIQGYKLEAFNMYDEREEGNFTEAGSYQDKSYARRREDNNRAFLRGEKIKRTVKRSVLEDDPEDDAEAGQDAWLDEYDEQVEAFAASVSKSRNAIFQYSSIRFLTSNHLRINNMIITNWLRASNFLLQSQACHSLSWKTK